MSVRLACEPGAIEPLAWCHPACDQGLADAAPGDGALRVDVGWRAGSR